MSITDARLTQSGGLRGLQAGAVRVMQDYEAEAPAFSPATIAGCLGWYDAQDAATFTLSGDDVVTWADKSGNGYHCTTPATGNRPTRASGDTINGFQALGFSNDELQSPMPDDTKPFTLVAVINPNTAGFDRVLIGGEMSGGAMAWLISGDRHMMLALEGSSVLSTSTTALTGPSVVALTYSGSGVITHYIDGVVDNTYTNNVTFSSPRTTIIGRAWHDGQEVVGKIGEIIKYDSVLSAGDRTALFDYLQAKWGLWRRSLIQAPANGTTSHTINFTPASAGSLLVCVIAGSVTHSTPTGWTKQASAINNTELCVLTKTATAGESSFTTTHNNPNRVIAVVVYEFPAGTAWVTQATANNQSSTAANPTISGLTPGTGLMVFAAIDANDQIEPGAAWTCTVAGATEDVEVDMEHPPGEAVGTALTVAYVANYGSTSYGPSVTHASTDFSTSERVTFAVQLP